MSDLGSNGKEFEKKAYVCIDCIREGSHDIWILPKPKESTFEEWRDMTSELDKHKEEVHGTGK